MMRRVIFIFGVLLLLISGLLASERRIAVADSMSFALVPQNPQGTQLLRIDFNGKQVPLFVPPPDTQILRFEWSPDGEWILITLKYTDAEDSGEIYLVHRSGKQTRRIYQVPYIATGAQFSPDGQSIAFIRYGDHGDWTRGYVIQIDKDGKQKFKSQIGYNDEFRIWELYWVDKSMIVAITNPNIGENYQFDIQSGYQIPFTADNYLADSLENKSDVRINILNFDIPIHRALQSSNKDWTSWITLDSHEGSIKHDLYVAQGNNSRFIRLTLDGEVKNFIPIQGIFSEHGEENETQPFSPENQWLAYGVFVEDTIRILNVIRTDGSGQKISSLYEGDIINARLQWAPYIPHQFNMVALFLGGLLAVVVGGGWQFSQRRQET